MNWPLRKSGRARDPMVFTGASLQALPFYLFLLVLVLAPLPLASNREWSWTLLCLLVGVIGVLWAVLRIAEGAPASPQQRRLPALLPMLILAVIAWALFQASALAPVAWWHPLWSMSAEILHGDAGAVTGHISLATEDSVVAAIRLLCYGLAFFLAYQWGRDVHRARRTLHALVLAGAAYAIYGLAAHWGGRNTLFWFEDSRYHTVVHSTFVNRNHFATYTGMVLLCSLALFYDTLQRHHTPAARMPVGRVPKGARVTTAGDRLEQFALLAWKPLLLVLLLTTAIVLTASRGGFISTLAGGAVLLVALNFQRPLRSARSLAFIVLTAGMAVVAFWLTSEMLLDRLDHGGMEANLRFAAYDLVTESSRDNPLLGFGYGTFADSFRLYRSDAITGYLDRAHNTYLENLFELGWPAALALFATVGGAFLVCLRGLHRRGKDWFYPAMGLAVTVLVAIHAWFDFSLQIPAVAITYAVIMGVACAQSYSDLPP